MVLGFGFFVGFGFVLGWGFLLFVCFFNYLFPPTNILPYSNLQEDCTCLGERKEAPLFAFPA